MMKKLKILIANDDGIRSSGIVRLAKAASEFGDVWVAAPEHQCSGMSVRLTIAGMPEMAVYRYDFPVPVQAAWSVDGTPADCVKVALRSLLGFRPDVVLSGVNDGMNAGHDVCYSGTVGAATYAALNGIHTIAFSMGKASAVDVAEQNLPAMLEELLFAPLNPGELWNVNFPPCPAAECKGVLRGRFPEKHSFYENYYTCLREENGVQYLTPVPKEVLTREETQEGSDIHAVLNGYISIGKVRCAAY